MKDTVTRQGKILIVMERFRIWTAVSFFCFTSRFVLVYFGYGGPLNEKLDIQDLLLKGRCLQPLGLNLQLTANWDAADG